MKLLIHSTHGQEAPTQADRAFLLAEAALAQGHAVSMFLAGTAVHVCTQAGREQVLGIGAQAVAVKVRIARIQSAGGHIVLSRLSAEARGMDTEWLLDAGYELAEPSVFIAMTEACDKLITYG